MSYDLIPSNKKLEPFHIGCFSWPRLISITGYFFCYHENELGKYTFNPVIDKRMGTDYPKLITSDGFRVTSIEAKFMSRIILNYLTLEHPDHEDLTEENCLHNSTDGWIMRLTKFVIWSKKSKGFKIC